MPIACTLETHQLTEYQRISVSRYLKELESHPNAFDLMPNRIELLDHSVSVLRDKCVSYDPLMGHEGECLLPTQADLISVIQRALIVSHGIITNSESLSLLNHLPKAVPEVAMKLSILQIAVNINAFHNCLLTSTLVMSGGADVLDIHAANVSKCIFQIITFTLAIATLLEYPIEQTINEYISTANIQN